MHKNMKMSVAMYSTFHSPGWKSEQLEVLVPLLRNENLFCKGYGIKRNFKRYESDLQLSILPLAISRLVFKLRFLPFICDYHAYLLGEYLLGTCYSNNIASDASSVVYIKPRPYNLVESCSRAGKKIILEFGEMHPNDTQRRLKSEYSYFNINSEYIFTSQYAIDESVKSIELADVIIVLSNESKRSFIRNGVPEHKIRVINLNLAKKYDNKYNDKKEFAFVSTATHSFVKGTHRLLLSWKKANIANVKLHIVGDLSNDMLDFLKAYGPFDNVIFTGKKKVSEYYNNYNFIGVLNSLSEGCPRAVIEYMGHGFPVITTPVATCDLVEHGVNGFIVDTCSELEDALIFFSENLEQYKSMGDNARHTAEETISNDFSGELFKLLKEEF